MVTCMQAKRHPSQPVHSRASQISLSPSHQTGPMCRRMLGQSHHASSKLKTSEKIRRIRTPNVTPSRVSLSRRRTLYTEQLVGEPQGLSNNRCDLERLMSQRKAFKKGGDAVEEIQKFGVGSQSPARRRVSGWQENEASVVKKRGSNVERRNGLSASPRIISSDNDKLSHGRGTKRTLVQTAARPAKRERPRGKENNPGGVIVIPDDDADAEPPVKGLERSRLKKPSKGGTRLVSVPAVVFDSRHRNASLPKKQSTTLLKSQPSALQPEPLAKKTDANFETLIESDGLEYVPEVESTFNADNAGTDRKVFSRHAKRKSTRSRRVGPGPPFILDMDDNDVIPQSSRMTRTGNETLPNKPDPTVGAVQNLDSDTESPGKPFARRRAKRSVTVPPQHARSTARSPGPQSHGRSIVIPRLKRQTKLNIKVTALESSPKPCDNEVIEISDDDQEEKKDSTDELAEKFSRQAGISVTQFYGSKKEAAAPSSSTRRSFVRRQSRKDILSDEEEQDGDEDFTVFVRSPSRRASREKSKVLGDIRLTMPDKDELDEINKLTAGLDKYHIVTKVKEANIELTVEHFDCLRGSRWLSDEVMNSFVALLNSRNKMYCSGLEEGKVEKNAKGEVPNADAAIQVRTEPKGGKNDAVCADAVVEVTTEANNTKDEKILFTYPRPRVHVFNTFFYARLTQNNYDYCGVRRWLKRAGREIQHLDMIMFPINISNLHWVLAAIDVRGKELLYFDSMNGRDSLGALEKLRQWYFDEVADKCGKETADALDIDSWRIRVNPQYLPCQQDGGSCGIFTLYMAEYLERGRCPNFTQRHIRALRKRTALFLRDGVLPQT